MSGKTWVRSIQVLAITALLLMPALPASARKIYTEFNYPFDQGGELHQFKAGEDTTVTWKAGGALGSIGCLKATGKGQAIVESEVTWFKAGDSTISFHYLSHGYTRLRYRLNTVQPEDRAKFGLYSQNFINNLPQDKWVFVQVKLADLKGDAKKGDPKGYPELVFKSFTFFADGGDNDSYLLLDNIRVGPQIEEKDIKVRTRDRKAVGSEKKMLLDFEDAAEARLVVPLKETDAAGKEEAYVTGEISNQWASSGKQSLKLTAQAGHPWAAVELDPSLLPGWEKFDYLAFDMYSDDARFVTFNLEFWDADTKGYPTRCTLLDQVEIAPPRLHKGVTHFQIDLRTLRLNGKEAVGFGNLSKEDKIDAARMAKVKMWFKTDGLKGDYAAYMDNVRLVQEGALESNMKIALPTTPGAGALAFDFGEGSPVVEGFKEASIIDVWEEGKDYGFVDPENLAAQGFDWPDPLTGDFIGPKPGDDNAPAANANFEFRVKVPNGRYRVWLAAGYFPNPDRYIDLNVNGKIEYSMTMSPERFLSEKGYFRFLNTDYSEKPNALWRNYIDKLYPTFVEETEVGDGVLTIKGANSFIGALVIVPADQKTGFDDMVKQIESERMRYFYKDLFLLRSPNEPTKAVDKDLLLFAPAEGRSLLPWSGMDNRDATSVQRIAAPGEAVPFQVALRPFRDLPNAKLSVSDLQGPGAAKIPAKSIEVFLKQYLSDGMTVKPWCLVPRDTVDLEKDLVRSVWLRVRVPQDAAPGTYKGALTVAAGEVTRKLDIQIEVLPVRLRDDIPLALGCFYDVPDGGQFAMLDKIDKLGPTRDKILREQMEIMKDYGQTSPSLPAPAVKELQGSGVALDFSAIAKASQAARDAGLLANPVQRAPMSILGAARSIQTLLDPAKSNPGEELKLKGFDSAYVSAVMQTQEWAQEQKLPLAFWVVDEPRENPNPWNRNLADTIAHLKLAGQVKGVARMVTPMGDEQSGKDYLSLCDYLEIVDTHAGKASEKLMARAMNSGGKLELWIYNVGADRLSNGLYLWRIGATGKHEWHFNQWTAIASGRKWPTAEPNVPFSAHSFNPYTVPAPLTNKGALLPMEGLLTMSVGAADYRYIYTLEQAIARCKADKTNAAKAAEAEKFLADLKAQVPILPPVKNLEDLSGVGEGLDVAVNLEAARKAIAQFIVALQGEAK